MRDEAAVGPGREALARGARGQADAQEREGRRRRRHGAIVSGACGGGVEQTRRGRRRAAPRTRPRTSAPRRGSPARASQPRSRSALELRARSRRPRRSCRGRGCRRCRRSRSTIARVVLLGAEAVDERAVDLDARRPGSRLQVGERRVAGAEVVEQHADAERAAAARGSSTARRRPSSSTLSVISRPSVPGSRPQRSSASRDLGEELGPGELAAGDVDGDAEVGGVREARAPVRRPGGRPARAPSARAAR